MPPPDPPRFCFLRPLVPNESLGDFLSVWFFIVGGRGESVLLFHKLLLGILGGLL